MQERMSRTGFNRGDNEDIDAAMSHGKRDNPYKNGLRPSSTTTRSVQNLRSAEFEQELEITSKIYAYEQRMQKAMNQKNDQLKKNL